MLEATIERLRADALAATNATGYFAAMYARVTERIDAAITAGRFGDGDRMAYFARSFADWYLGPRAGTRPIPRCWQAATDVVDERRLLIVQHLLLGINAHVNHDLPQVVVELAGTDESIAGLRPDFDAINDILAETQSDILGDLGRVSGWTQVAAGIGGGRLFDFSLERARDQAWATAVRLHGLDGPTRSADVAELDRVVSALAFLITDQSAIGRWILAIPRRFEDPDPASVTTRLLAHLA